MVEVLALPSRLDMDRLPDVLEQAVRMLRIAATKASLIMRSLSMAAPLSTVAAGCSIYGIPHGKYATATSRFVGQHAV